MDELLVDLLGGITVTVIADPEADCAARNIIAQCIRAGRKTMPFEAWRTLVNARTYLLGHPGVRVAVGRPRR